MKGRSKPVGVTIPIRPRYRPPKPQPLNYIPIEIEREIIQFCPIKDIVSLSSVGKKERQVCNNDQLWEKLTRRDFRYIPNIVDIPWKDLYAKLYHTEKWLLTRAKLVTIDSYTLENFFSDQENEILANINQFVKTRGYNLKRGDIVIDLNHNSVKLIYNGIELEYLLYTNPDDYPVVTEFPIAYWNDIKLDSYIVGFEQARFIEQLVANSEVEQIGNEAIIRTSFEYDLYVYFVIVISLTTYKLAVEIEDFNLKRLYREQVYYSVTPYDLKFSYEKDRTLFIIVQDLYKYTLKEKMNRAHLQYISNVN